MTEHMSPIEQEQHHPELSDRDEPKQVETVETPDAMREAAIADRRVSDRKAFLDVRGRGVEWVRPTDLIARQSSRLAGRGLDLHTELARRSRASTVTGLRHLSNRARRLPPASDFGRGGTRPGPQRSGVGMR